MSNLISNWSSIRIVGDTQKEVSGICQDSRKIKSGEIFVARKGDVFDGHHYINEVIHRGVEVILCEYLPHDLHPSVCYLISDKMDSDILHLLKEYYNNPSEHLILTGVTGTNGKTTTATLLFHNFRALGFKCGLISTIRIIVHDHELESTHTTPDLISLYALLNNMVEAGCSHVFMEVSSHALVQNRIAGLKFALAIFTNITQDHLDFHGTMTEYIKGKKKFFDQLEKSSFALINSDDRNSSVMVQNTVAKVYTYAIHSPADFQCKILESDLNGMELRYKNISLYTSLIGEFNAYNLMAVLGSSILLGIEEQEAMQAISSLKPVEGRFEWIKGHSKKLTAVIDYAHTDDAVEKILQSIRSICMPQQRIITVIGCGGNRDRDKRPKMAQAAVLNSDQVILTSDNPRNEEPGDIINEMENGLTADQKKKTLSIVDRHQAIKTACIIANTNDIILIAGKGHEKYQEIKGKKIPFDDKKEIEELFIQDI